MILMIASSTDRRYQCRSCLCRLRSIIGYPTSWPGPWNVTSPPRSTSNSSTPFDARKSGLDMRFFCFDDRPSVTTGGCSTRSSTSCGIAPRDTLPGDLTLKLESIPRIPSGRVERPTARAQSMTAPQSAVVVRCEELCRANRGRLRQQLQTALGARESRDRLPRR